MAAEIQSTVPQDISEVIQELKRRIGKAETELVVALFWVAWSARNQVLFKGKREGPRVLMAKAEAIVEEFRRIREPTNKDKASQKEKVQMCWSPPSN